MGAAIIVPESDARMTRLIGLFRLTDYDIGMFYKIFNRLGTLNLPILFAQYFIFPSQIIVLNYGVIRYILCYF